MKSLCGGVVVKRPGFFVEPTIVKLPSQIPIAREETFAPILYVMEYDDLEQAIATHNSGDQGLSSAIFTSSMYSAEKFLSHEGSDAASPTSTSARREP